MMKIEDVVGDLILIVLDNHEPLKKIGIDEDKLFVQVNGYDEFGMWISHPKFSVPNVTGKGKAKTKKSRSIYHDPLGFYSFYCPFSWCRRL